MIESQDFYCTTTASQPCKHSKQQVFSSGWPQNGMSLDERCTKYIKIRYIMPRFKTGKATLPAFEPPLINQTACIEKQVTSGHNQISEQNYVLHRNLYFCKNAGVAHSAGKSALPGTWQSMDECSCHLSGRKQQYLKKQCNIYIYIVQINFSQQGNPRPHRPKLLCLSYQQSQPPS